MRFRSLRRVAALVAIPALALGPGCARAPRTEPSSTRAVAGCTGSGRLEVNNLTGATVEVFALRPGVQTYLGLVSPGTQSFPIDYASDPTVTYLARDPGNPETATTVTWRARRTRSNPNGIGMTLVCTRPT